jgi:HTH-type transcriptional regulator/antitoxin HigA
MEIKPIHSENDYEAALKEIERLFDAEPGTPEGDKLEILAVLVEAYENEHYSIPLPDPIEAIEYHMERLGLTRKDLEIYIGGPSRVSEILNRKRPLNVRMIRGLSAGLGIPIEVLAHAYELNMPKLVFNAGSFPSLVGIPIADFKSANSARKTLSSGVAVMQKGMIANAGNIVISLDYQTAGSTDSSTNPRPFFKSSILDATEGTIQ